MKSKMSHFSYRVWIICAILTMALFSCSSAGVALPQSMRNDAQAPALAPVMEKSAGSAVPAAPMPGAPPPQEQEASVTSSTTNLPVERIIIKNAGLSISVADPAVSMNKISKMAEAMGGFVVSANMYKETISSGVEVPRASITIRVPAEKLNTALEQIRSESKHSPISETANSQDVTNEYVDLQSRQKNLEAAEADLVKIMDQAYKTEDVLNVFNQLVSIREQIEVIKGQIKYYNESARYSAINIELIADAALQPIEIGGWQPTGVVKEALKSFIQIMQGLVTVVIWLLLVALPVLFVLFVIFVLPPWLIIRAILKRRAKRKAGKTAIDQEEKPQLP